MEKINLQTQDSQRDIDRKSIIKMYIKVITKHATFLSNT